MIIPFPIALWVFSLVSDVMYLWRGNDHWGLTAFYTMAGGLLGGIVAAVPGIIDWLALKDRETVKVANWHARLNIAAIVVFGVSFYLRWRAFGRIPKESISLPFSLSIVGVILIAISGWLGGELSFKHRVGVAEEQGMRNEE
jgi:uncharacterized membrane protein